jgi:phosphoglycolate phosphatase
MKADAIIFDKDGTLIDFDAFWVSVSKKAIEEVFARLNIKEASVCEVLEDFGVHEGVTDINGTLCKGTYEELGAILYNNLKRHGCADSCEEVTKTLFEAYNNNADAGIVKPTCPDLANILERLKKQNKKLAVVTTDNMQITLKCLQKLGIEKFFDKIYTDDGATPTKPDPYCVFDFCKLFNLETEHVVMVGDTMTDMNFAKNAEIAAIGVAKNDKNKQTLAPHACAVISDPSHIFEVLS